MLKTKTKTFINEKRPHESGTKHVTGKAYYTDDIPESPETLYGAIGWSKKAHAIIKTMNNIYFNRTIIINLIKSYN